MKIPDVLGFTLSEAKAMLSSSGINICRITVTAPPKCKTVEYDDCCRVISLKGDNNKVELLVCKPL